MAPNHTTLHKVSHANKKKEKTRLRTTLERDPGSGFSAWQMVSSSAIGLTLIRKVPSVPTELLAASLWNSSQQLQVCSIHSWPHCTSPLVGWNNYALWGLASVRSNSVSVKSFHGHYWTNLLSKTTPSPSYTGRFKTTNNGSPHWPLWLCFELLYSAKILWVSHTMSRNHNTTEITS